MLVRRSSKERVFFEESCHRSVNNCFVFSKRHMKKKDMEINLFINLRAWRTSFFLEIKNIALHNTEQ